MNISLVWIRNDLRLEDNTALIEAIKDATPEDKIGMVFCIDPKQLKTGSYCHDYFFTALHTFYRNCLEKELVIHFLYGDTQDCFSKLIKEFPDIQKIYFNIDDSGYGMVAKYIKA